MEESTSVRVVNSQYEMLKKICLMKNLTVKDAVALAIADYIASNTSISMKDIEKMGFKLKK